MAPTPPMPRSGPGYQPSKQRALVCTGLWGKGGEGPRRGSGGSFSKWVLEKESWVNPTHRPGVGQNLSRVLVGGHL